MVKWSFRIIALVGILICIWTILVSTKPGLVIYLTESNPQRKILLGWLNKRDPGLFKRCKVFFGENIILQDVPMRQEGDHSIITAILCGGETKFWINNKTKRVDCYISYCGKNIGNKYCGSEIADKLCEQ